jgi:uncharacterized membrane-anchored protein YhcB (DUF1043 family)
MNLTYVEAIIAAIAGGLGIAVFNFLKRSIKRELTQVIEETVKPELKEIHERIDETHKRIDNHMDQEEADIKALIRILAKISDSTEEDIRRQL